MAETSQTRANQGRNVGSAGWRQITAPGDAGETIPVTVCYPTQGVEVPQPIGPYTIAAAWEAPPRPGPHPLVMLSHGSGSSPLVNRDLALAMARSGFVVGMPLHPGDNHQDRSAQGTTLTLQRRPRHVQVALTALLADPQLAPVTRGERIGLIGHSLGAYTALALAGGEPRTLPESWPNGASEPIPAAHDARVAALVLLAPAAIWFHAPGSLDAVNVPVLMLAGERDVVTPAHHAALVAQRLPAATPLHSRIIPGAGHFAFLSVFPPAMQQPDFAPAQDPPRFNRSAFQTELAAEVAAFLHDRLRTQAPPGV
ncbi:MAG: hypothetical protein KC442_18075 [Thermomicrobiales bacterium]|nr:hypothetical protein [Thermomicrobiales bacterium]